MFEKIKTTGLPSDGSLHEIRVAAAVGSCEPTWEQADEEGLNLAEFWKLLKAWREFRGPVKDADHFQVAVPLDEDVYAAATYHAGEVIVEVLDADEIDLDLVMQVPFAGQRKSDPKVGPNDPCPCGKGRKFKKCCGR